MWHRPQLQLQFDPVAEDLPCAMGEAIKRGKKKRDDFVSMMYSKTGEHTFISFKGDIPSQINVF